MRGSTTCLKHFITPSQIIKMSQIITKIRDYNSFAFMRL